MKTVDESLKYADDFCSSESYLVCLAAEVRRLRECLGKANASAEHFEREWYLRGDEIELLREENERLRKDAAVSTAIERAAAELPDGDMMEITIEKGSAMVVLYWGQGGFETMDVDDDNRLAAEINAAIDAARGAK